MFRNLHDNTESSCLFHFNETQNISSTKLLEVSFHRGTDFKWRCGVCLSVCVSVCVLERVRMCEHARGCLNLFVFMVKVSKCLWVCWCSCVNDCILCV